MIHDPEIAIQILQSRNCNPETMIQKLWFRNCNPETAIQKLQSRNWDPETVIQKLRSRNCDPETTIQTLWSRNYDPEIMIQKLRSRNRDPEIFFPVLCCYETIGCFISVVTESWIQVSYRGVSYYRSVSLLILFDLVHWTECSKFSITLKYLWPSFSIDGLNQYCT